MGFGYGWLNLSSLLLGLLAWFLPLLRMAQLRHNESVRALHRTTFFSMTACSLALLLQLFYGYYLIDVQGWSSLMDTVRAVCLAAVVLLVVTLLLNLPLLSFGAEETDGDKGDDHGEPV